MPPRKKQPPNTASIGWRLQQLRLRRGLLQKDLARLAGIDPSFLNRLENSSAHAGRPRPDTLARVLDAMDATPWERNALFHQERPPVSPEIVRSCVAQFAAMYEDSPSFYSMYDDRRFRIYHNKTARAGWGLTEGDYARSTGGHPLMALIDPSEPMYRSYRDEDRHFAFAWLAASFKLAYRSQEFDSWYLDLVARVKAVPWAAELWDNPSHAPSSPFADSGDFILLHPITRDRTLHFKGRMSTLLEKPNFGVGEMIPRNEDTSNQLAELRTLPQYSYSVAEDF